MISLFIEDLEGLLKTHSCFGKEGQIKQLIDKWKQIEKLRLKSVKEEQSKSSRLCKHCGQIIDHPENDGFCSSECFEKHQFKKKDQEENT